MERDNRVNFPEVYDIFSREKMDFSPSFSESEKKEIFEICSRLSELIHEKGFRNLVIVDRSSRPVFVGIKEYWKIKYPSEPLPNIYFVNPKGFKAAEKHTKRELEIAGARARFAEDEVEEIDSARTTEVILEDFLDTYKKLLVDREKPLLVFDSCIHSGATLKPVIDIFHQVGFDNVSICSVRPSDIGSSVESDFTLIDERSGDRCCPFGRDLLINKTFTSVSSKRNTNNVDRIKAIEIRRLIKEIIREGTREE